MASTARASTGRGSTAALTGSKASGASARTKPSAISLRSGCPVQRNRTFGLPSMIPSRGGLGVTDINAPGALYGQRLKRCDLGRKRKTPQDLIFPEAASQIVDAFRK